MPRTKQPPPEVTPAEQESTFQLEPINEDLQSRLNVMGNSMRIFVETTHTDYPGWSAMVAEIFDVIRITIEQMKEAS